LNVLDEGIPKERSTWWRLPDPGEPELLSASFHRRSFARHAHERFAIGVIEAGALAFRYRGQELLAPAGWVNMAFPGEAHTGQSAGSEGWTYRMFYLDPALVLEAAQSLDPSRKALPFISAGAVCDPELALRVQRLHRLCEDPASDPLARQVMMGHVLEDVIARYGGAWPEHAPGRERSAVLRAKHLIDEACDCPVQLADLAALTGFNPYRLVRCFTRELGMPPHAYLVQVRVRRAAELLRKGLSPGRAALESGFADQSHLNRHFLKSFGVTPGAFRKATTSTPDAAS
jgi:AraC-like DNA-binding protein